MTRSDSTLLVTRLDQIMTRFDSTRKILDDSDSKGMWLWLDSDSIKMTRAHHCCLLDQKSMVSKTSQVSLIFLPVSGGSWLTC